MEKRIIFIRSLRVVLALLFISVSMSLMVFVSYWFSLLLLPGIFFLDISDSMLEWRLKRITIVHIQSSLIYIYLIATLVGIGMVSCVLLNKDVGIREKPYTLALLMYFVLIAIFSFRYFIIVVRVMTRYHI